MKHIGKIINFNGTSGEIIDIAGITYILSKNNIIYPNPQNGDIVIFKVEEFNTVEVNERIAIFVSKIEEKNTK